jgi:predicted extracellular nuclease
MITSFNALYRTMGLITISGIILGLIVPGVFSVYAAPGEISAGEVIIHEIMQNPSAVTDGSGEWFEIYNPTASDIDIDGWTIRDDGSDSHLIDNGGSLILPAGGYLVLGNNGDSATNGEVAIDYVYPSNWYLGNGDDEVIILDDSLNEIDRVEYDGGPNFPDPNGASMSLSDPTSDNNEGANWCESTTPYGDGDFGTPGLDNDCSSPPTPPPTPAVSIYDIQYTDDPGGDSPYDDQAVTTEGIVTAVFNIGYFIQDPAFNNWGGLWVYDDGNLPGLGDLLQLTGTVDEYNNLTELKNLTDYQVLSSGNTLPDPVVLFTGDVFQERWEGMLARVEDVTVTNNDLGHGEWEVDDSSGAIIVDDMGSYAYVPANGDLLDFVQGPLNYSNGAFKIEPRDDNDIGIPLDYTPIYDIQYTTDLGGDSPYEDEVVTTEGLVTAVFDSGYFIQDPEDSGWSGLWVYDSNTPGLGDRLRLTGIIDEYYNLTELKELTDYQVLSSGNALPDPVLLSTAVVSDEQWEGMLVRVEDVTVTNKDLDHGEWEVDDGSGGVVVDDMGGYTYSPTKDDLLEFVQGPLNYSHDAFKIEPRDDDDIGVPEPPSPPVAIYDIQYTEDPSGDSPYAEEMVTTQGVVTAFFYDGGNRYTFIQDGTGPWSGLLLYKPDGFVNVGDLLQVEGTVSEYYGMTQITSGTATVLSSDHPLPSPELLLSGEVNQEQWESVLVRVEDVTVINDDLGYGEWLVKDSSGEVRVDDMGSYTYSPANGNFLDFVQGPLNYSFDDFKIEPRDDDDLGIAPPFVAICEIQGSGFTSPYEGQSVRTQGIVVADFDQTGMGGFYLQEGNCDGDPATSDGIFVYIGRTSHVVSSGDRVEVRGLVQEYYNLTEIRANSGAIDILSEENSLPEPIDLNPPFDNAASDVYFESLEGMYVSMGLANVVGPTDYFDETFVVRSDLGLIRIFQDHPDGTGVIVAVDDSGLFEIQPEAKIGDQVSGLLGALDYSYDDYKIQLTAPPWLIQAPDPAKRGDVDGDGDIDLADLRMITKYWGRRVPPAPASADLDGDGRITYWDVLAFLRLYRKLTPSWGEFSVATFNLQNLFDTVNEPEKDDPEPSVEEYTLQLDKLAEAIHDDLMEPTIIGVQEAENLMVLADLAARSEIRAEYEAVLVDGPDARGIDVGLLYRVDQVRVLDYESRQSCTTLVDGLGPDGNLDVYDPVNDITCDSDGDGVLDGNRLFSRPPLVVHLEFGTEWPRRGWTPMDDLYVIVNHFKSKSQDTEEVQYTLPRRVEQAGFVVGLTQEIRASDWGAKVIVLGDLNDFLNSETLAVLKDGGLLDLLYETPKPNRYTYTYKGESEVLDHILINQRLRYWFRSLEPVHINADYPVVYEDTPDLSRRSSDHDPVMAKFMLRFWWGW